MRRTRKSSLPGTVYSEIDLITHIHQRPTQVTRYNTGYTSVQNIPGGLPVKMRIGEPIVPKAVPQDPMTSELQKISKNLLDMKDPSKVEEMKSERAESQLKGDFTDLDNIKKTIAALDKMKVDDPEIQARLDRLKERRDAYQQIMEEKPERADADEQERVNKIKKELKKKTPETAKMEKAITDTEAATASGSKLYTDLTTRVDPTKYDAADTAVVDNQLDTYNRVVSTGTYKGKDARDLLMNSVWGTGDSKFFTHTHNKHGDYAKSLRGSVTDSDLEALTKLGKTYPEVRQFMQDSASLGTMSKTSLTKPGSSNYHTAAFKNAAEGHLREIIRSLAPNATKKQLIAMNKIVDATNRHMRIP